MRQFAKPCPTLRFVQQPAREVPWLHIATPHPMLGATKAIDDLRRAGKILGVWDKEAATFVYPCFQFEPKVSDASRHRLLSQLASLAGFVPTDDPGSWRRAFWLYQPDRRLSPRCCAYDRHPMADPIAAVQYLLPFSDNARTPAETFADEPNSVFALVDQIGAD